MTFQGTATLKSEFGQKLRHKLRIDLNIAVVVENIAIFKISLLY